MAYFRNPILGGILILIDRLLERIGQWHLGVPWGRTSIGVPASARQNGQRGGFWLYGKDLLTAPSLQLVLIGQGLDKEAAE